MIAPVEVDRALVERVERNAVDCSFSLARAMAALEPDSGATAVALCDGVLVFTGVGMYVNRGVGLGVREPIEERDLDALEAFFGERMLPPELEVCPWADDSLLRILGRRGYTPRLFRDVFVHDLRELHDLDDLTTRQAETAITIQEVEPRDRQLLHAVRADGFGQTDPAARENSDRFSAAAASQPGAIELLAWVDGEPVGAASVQLLEGVASLGGMSTVPAARGRGLQGALLRHRLRLAEAAGCDLVVVSAVPDSASARNIRRHGFTLAYTQVIAKRPQ
jgi:GNAT superfamily N-acetyltransferase